MPTEEPRCAGLTNTGRPSAASSASTPSRSARQRVMQAAVLHLRQPGGPHQGLEADLVHAQRRGGDAAADVGHIEALEQPLDNAVLPVGAMQRREDDVDFEQPAGRRKRQLAAVEQPAAVARDLDRDRLVPAFEQSVAHRRRRGERDRMLGRAAATQNCDAHQDVAPVPAAPVAPLGPVLGGAT